MGAHKGQPSWNKGKKLSISHRKNLSIAHSGKKLTLEHRKNIGKSCLGRIVTKETREKIKLAQVGEKSCHWVKDRSKLKAGRTKSYDTKYKYWMLGVKNRDGWKCMLKNNECSGRMEAHHILNWEDNPGLRYIISNGICLCHFHHPKNRTSEKMMEDIFKEILWKQNN